MPTDTIVLRGVREKKAHGPEERPVITNMSFRVLLCLGERDYDLIFCARSDMTRGGAHIEGDARQGGAMNSGATEA